jgi:hypothetical protein
MVCDKVMQHWAIVNNSHDVSIYEGNRGIIQIGISNDSATRSFKKRLVANLKLDQTVQIPFVVTVSQVPGSFL